MQTESLTAISSADCPINYWSWCRCGWGYSHTRFSGEVTYSISRTLTKPLLTDKLESVHIFYPFVDLLEDGYSSFVYEKYLILTRTSVAAIEGAEAYGIVPIPATFEPANNAYAFSHFSEIGENSGAIFLNAYTNLSDCPAVTTRFEPLPFVGPWPLELYVHPSLNLNLY